MASKNIVLKETTYNGVESITLPVSGGSSATFYEISDTTAVEADVASSKYFYNASGVYTQGTASGGGGGSSKYVTGTFTPSANTGTAETLTVPYTGIGYPVAILIAPEEGAYNTSGTFYNTIQQYAIIMYCMSKANIAEPNYSGSGNDNAAEISCVYKSSSTSPTTTTASRGNGASCYVSSVDASDNVVSNLVKIQSATTMSYFVASTSYGFRSGTEYRYHIIYSS